LQDIIEIKHPFDTAKMSGSMSGFRAYQTFRSVSDLRLFVICRDGYALVRCEEAVFKPEV
jgi:hypothetical protein